MEFGTKIKGGIQYIPRDMLSESVPGSIYQLKIQTRGVSDPARAINLLKTELPKKFPGLKVLWANVEGEMIYLQISGSPFLWQALLLFLPTLLGLIGIVIVLVAVYLVFAAVPGWVIGILLAGIGLIIFGPSIGEWVLAGVPIIEEVP